MRVLILDITAKTGGYGYSNYYELIGKLQSGLEIYINSYHYDLKEYIGRHVEMLLCVLRSPYLERGMKPQPFLPGEYYSLELIDELLKEKGQSPGTSERELILTGEYIDYYMIPEEWTPLITPRSFQLLLKEPSALKTEDGIFLLSPVHLRKRIPIEQFPQEVSIGTGCIDLAAWHPF